MMRKWSWQAFKEQSQYFLERNEKIYEEPQSG